MKFKLKNKKLFLFVLAFALCFPLISACSKNNNSTEDGKQAPATATRTWALTGLVAPEDSKNRVAVSVKVENSIDARPQTDLDKADIVWEEIVEGGIPRFVASFNSQYPTNLGPVRSIRPMDPGIVGPLKSVIACSGGQRQFINKAKKAGLQVITMDAAGVIFARKGPKPAPHNVYLNMEKLLPKINKKHNVPATPQFDYAQSANETTASELGKIKKTVPLKMAISSAPTWKWDATKNVWLRFEGTKPATTTNAGQLTAKNVIVIKTKTKMAKGHDPAGNPIPETIMTGSGKGIVLSNGKVANITWKKKSDKSVLELFDSNGQAVSLTPGNSWVELMPITTGSY